MKRAWLTSCAALAVSALGLGDGPAQAQIYSNNFNDGTANGFTVVGAQGGANAAGVVSFDSNAHRFIGILTQGASATLALTGITAGATLNLSFDVYGFHSLDNDNPSSPGGDYFDVFANTTRLVHDEYGFVTCVGGCYGTTTIPSELPVTGTFVSEDPNGFGSGSYYVGERTYHYNLSFTAPATAFALSFLGDSNQAWNDEGFGLDNVVVSSVAAAAVPEPATWATMVLGFGAIGVMSRRRRSVAISA